MVKKPLLYKPDFVQDTLFDLPSNDPVLTSEITASELPDLEVPQHPGATDKDIAELESEIDRLGHQGFTPIMVRRRLGKQAVETQTDQGEQLVLKPIRPFPPYPKRTVRQGGSYRKDGSPDRRTRRFRNKGFWEDKPADPNER